jgi:hypothetical protein
MSSVRSSSDNSRKATKKLREIEILKLKTIRTKEEDEKIRKEPIYRRILDPLYKTDAEKQEEARINERKKQDAEEQKSRQYARHIEKERKRERKSQKKHMQEKEREKQRQQESNYENSKREYNERDERKQYERHTFVNLASILSDIEVEYIELLKKNNNNNDKTFRTLSKKYHPDMNLNNTAWAEENQKKLVEIRDSFQIM